MEIRYDYQAMLIAAEVIRKGRKERLTCEVGTYQKEADELRRDDVVMINGENWLVDDVRSTTTLGKVPFTEYTITASQPLTRW